MDEIVTRVVIRAGPSQSPAAPRFPAIDRLIQWEESMDRIQRNTDASSEQLEEMREQVKRLAE